MAKAKEKLTIVEAVDNLSHMAELDMIPTHEEGEEARPETNKETVRETFRTVFSYLEHLYKKDKDQLREPTTQKGIKAMMILAGEAAVKLDKFTNIFKGTALASVTELKEFKDLQEFYQNKIRRRFQEALATEEAYQEEWKSTPADLIDAERRCLKNLETVKRDKRYELFYIKNEDGTPFFNKSLLRHIKLVGDFDEGVSQLEEEDYFKKIRIAQDRDLQGSAKEILRDASAYLDEFYKEATKHKGRELVTTLNKTVMALMLAANPRNLILNTTAKYCLQYYEDFHLFLRETLSMPEYRELSGLPSEKLTGFSRVIVNLTLALSGAFFTRTSQRESAVEAIQRMIQSGAKELSSGHIQVHEPLLLWNSILDADEEMRSYLKQNSNGPILKTFELLNEERNPEVGFDPLSQGNNPFQIFTFADDKNHVTLLHLPSPTRQEYINRADVVEEFRAFMRYLNLRGAHKKHLLINLQDRTSWEEHARCQCLEKIQNEDEYADNLYVVTLTKDTEFYLQSGDYLEVNDSDAFIAQFKDQLASGEQCGFYFPPRLRSKEFDDIINELIEKIHRYFFKDKKELTRKNRLDFIEIFYHFFTLKLIDWVNPDTLSFTSKDSLDTGAAAGASFFSFLRMMSSRESFSQKEKNDLLWMFNSPALTVRGRLIDAQRMSRSVSCLAHMHTEFDERAKELIKAFNEFYSTPLETIKLKEV